MRQREFGNTGLRVSVLGLGAGQVGAPPVLVVFFVAVAFTAFDSGNLTPFAPAGIAGISAAVSIRPALFSSRKR